jgi:hypothetical protein
MGCFSRRSAWAKKVGRRIPNAYSLRTRIYTPVKAETNLEPTVLEASKVLSESLPDTLSIFMCAFYESHKTRSSYLSLVYSDSPNIQVHLDGRAHEAHSHRA